MKNKIAIFIDTVAHKNQLQAEAIYKYGYEPNFFVSKYNNRAESFIQMPGEQIVLADTFRERYKQVSAWFKKNRNSIHHIEVYPGGRFSFIYILLAKLNGVPSVCVERGDLLYYNRNGYGMTVRVSMWICYKMSDIVWYREPYMKSILEKLNRKLFFLHNAVRMPQPGNNDGLNKDVTFLWLNRIIPQRRYDWFVDILSDPRLANCTNLMVGLDGKSLFKKEQEYVLKNKPANLELAEYTADPVSFYKRSKFFVLPAEVVFANNALLEAMSYGVVPLISNKAGSALIVENGIDGFICKHSKEDFEATMLKAFDLSDEEYNQMSTAAAEKMREKFSEEKYQEAIKELYHRLDR